MANIGHQFRNQRIAKNITLKTAQNGTHLRAHVITAIETDDFGYFHSFAQYKGFATMYAEFLGILSDDLIIELKLAYDFAKPAKNTPPKPASQNEQPDQTPAEPETTQPEHLRIYQRIAEIFRQRRELLGITPEEAEWHSHIRAGVIKLIESGKFDDFGAPIQAKGLLISYAHFLEIDPEEVETLFGEAILKKRLIQEPRSPSPAPTPRKPRTRFLFGLINWDTIMIGGVVIFAAALFFWAAINFFKPADVAIAVETATLSVSDVLLEPEPETTQVPLVALEAEPTATSDALIEEGGEQIADVPTQGVSGNVNVTLIVLEKAYLRVLVDGEEVLNTRGAAGSALEYHADNSVEVLTGSGRSVKVIYNGQDLGNLGNYGESVLRIFSANGVITPTPSITPTPTITPSPTITPRPTLTPRPSATPL